MERWEDRLLRGGPSVSFFADHLLLFLRLDEPNPKISIWTDPLFL
jgi:hypothetical protein